MLFKNVYQIVKFECPGQFAFFRLASCDVDGHQELLEVEKPVPVGVEDPHDVRTELVAVTWTFFGKKIGLKNRDGVLYENWVEGRF